MLQQKESSLSETQHGRLSLEFFTHPDAQQDTLTSCMLSAAYLIEFSIFYFQLEFRLIETWIQVSPTSASSFCTTSKFAACGNARRWAWISSGTTRLIIPCTQRFQVPTFFLKKIDSFDNCEYSGERRVFARRFADVRNEFFFVLGRETWISGLLLGLMSCGDLLIVRRVLK